MKITYIYLKGFKRFPLTETDVFEYTFKSKLVMISGQNGAGKSSLLNELTPMPSDKSNFTKNGFKEIHIEHNNSSYILVCDYRENASYSFIVNNEELNLSGNITAQKDLVFKHFHINAAIHELLVGAESFTNMSLLSRKKLFNSITHLNIDALLDNYNKLKEELKSNEILLKSNISITQIEEQKLINKDYLTQLQLTLSRTKEFINFLLEFRATLTQHTTELSLEAVYSNTQQIQNKIKQILNKYNFLLTAYPYKDIPKYKTQHTSQINLTQYQLEQLYTQLEKKQEELRLLHLSNKVDLNVLSEKKKLLQLDIDSLQSRLNILTDIQVDLQPIESCLYMLESALPELLRAIPINTDKQYSREKYNTYIADREKLLSTLTSLSTTEISINKELEHLSKHSDLTVCPSCNYSWSINDTVKTIEKLRKELHSTLTDKLAVQTKLQEVNSSIDQIVNYFDIYKQYSTLKSNTTRLKEFWAIVDSKQYIFLSPTDILQQLKLLSNDIMHIRVIQKNNKELLDINNNLDLLDKVKNTNLEQVNIYLEDINNSIQEKLEVKKALQDSVSLLNKITTVYTHVDSLQKALEASRSDLFTVNIAAPITNILNAIDTVLSTNKITAIEIEKELSSHSSIQMLIDKYTTQNQELQNNIKILNIVLTELSPKNGLIAKSVSTFLNIIINSINSTIDKIWDYKMTLKPIDIEYDSLNYKFRVEVENKIIIDDVNKISSGMQEIVNLSFKLTLYRLLNLENYPIFFDELGGHLDNNHKKHLLSLVSEMSNNERYSQIFIITHTENYSYLKDLEHIDLSY